VPFLGVVMGDGKVEMEEKAEVANTTIHMGCQEVFGTGKLL